MRAAMLLEFRGRSWEIKEREREREREKEKERENRRNAGVLSSIAQFECG
jgi:hypothetical protein